LLFIPISLNSATFATRLRQLAPHTQLHSNVSLSLSLTSMSWSAWSGSLNFQLDTNSVFIVAFTNKLLQLTQEFEEQKILKLVEQYIPKS
jgi:hypothetical protein